MRGRLHCGPPLLGIFVQTPSGVVAELISGLGVDFVCVEAEHSAMGRETVQALVAAAGCPAFVRVAQNASVEIAAALDAGAAGVIVPRVDSADEAAAAVAAARYPPEGVRGLGPGRATGYGRTIADYFGRANGEIAVGVQIESVAAVEHVEEIVRVEGIDFIFIGPGDLTVSLGVPFGDARVAEAVDGVIAVATAVGLPVGIWTPTAVQAAGWFGRGVQLVILGSDLAFLGGAVEQAVADARAPR